MSGCFKNWNSKVRMEGSISSDHRLTSLDCILFLSARVWVLSRCSLPPPYDLPFCCRSEVPFSSKVKFLHSTGPLH